MKTLHYRERVVAVSQRLTFSGDASSGLSAALVRVLVVAADQELRRLSLRPLPAAAGRAGFSARRPVTYLCRTLAIRVW